MFKWVKIHTVVLKIGRGKGKEAGIPAGNETVQNSPSLASLPTLPPAPIRCCLCSPRLLSKGPSLRGVVPAQVTEGSQCVALSGWAPSLGRTKGAGRRARQP